MRRQPTDARFAPHEPRLGALLLAAALGLSAAPAGALGLGDLRLESYISEPLESTLTLLTSEEEDLSADCFAVVALPGRDIPSLTGARIALERSGARATLKIRTLAPVSEPVVRFRLTSTCSSSGGLSRDYLLLLDPRPAISGPIPVVAQPPEPVTPAKAAVSLPPVTPPAAVVQQPAAPALPPGPAARPSEAPKAPPKAQRPARPAVPAAPPTQLPPSAAPAAAAPAPQARPPAGTEAPAPSRSDGAFRLRLSSAELDTSRSRDVDERKRAEFRERRLLLEQDDQTAAVLGLRENLRQLEAQLADLQRRVTAARPAASPEAGAPSQPPATPAASPDNPRPPAPKQPLAAESAVDWSWVILGLVLALAAGGLAFWKRRSAGGEPVSDHSPAPRNAAAPEMRVAARPRPAVVEEERAAPPKASSTRPAATTPPAEELHDPAQLRQQYRRARFPEIALGAVSLADPASVVRGARTLYEDGARHRAVELLEIAIADDPRPVAPWLALLEIQRQEGMASEFCALAARFKRQHPNAAEWPKVQSIGRDFDPDNPLFVASGKGGMFDPLTDNWLEAPSDFSPDGEAAALHAAAVAGALERRRP